MTETGRSRTDAQDPDAAVVSHDGWTDIFVCSFFPHTASYRIRNRRPDDHLHALPQPDLPVPRAGACSDVPERP